MPKLKIFPFSKKPLKFFIDIIFISLFELLVPIAYP